MAADRRSRAGPPSRDISETKISNGTMTTVVPASSRAGRYLSDASGGASTCRPQPVATVLDASSAADGSAPR